MPVIIAALKALFSALIADWIPAWLKPRPPKTVVQRQAEAEAKPDTSWDETVDRL